MSTRNLPDDDPLEGPSSRPLNNAKVNNNKRSATSVHIMEMESMFPKRLRKSPGSLFDLSQKKIVKTLRRYVKSRQFKRYEGYLRHHLQGYLHPQLQSQILSQLMPSDDKWNFACIESGNATLACRAHWECRLVLKHCDRILKILFSPKLEELTIDLRRVDPNLYISVFRQLNKSFSDEIFPNLEKFIIQGGTVYTDELVRPVEKLCEKLVEGAPALKELWLPICTNQAMRHISDLKGLTKLKIDRTRGFNRRGLWHLCHPDSKSRSQLEILHLGVFKHHHFNKVDASKFLQCMQNLKVFNLLDDQRALTRVGNMFGNGFGDKVMIYSALKLAIIDSLSSNQAVQESGFRSSLEHIKVVDRILKPRYLLNSCPGLKYLYIDWQEELCLPPFNQYEPSWFSNMLRDPEWEQLLTNLLGLEVVFPAAYSPNNYSLPILDSNRFLPRVSNLRKIKLVGAGKESPLPLIHLLFHCVHLVDLHLEKTSVHVPDDYEVVHAKFVSKSLVKFCFLGDMNSLIENKFLTRGIATYMPALAELEIQPEGPIGFKGLAPKQMLDLAKLKNLEKLSLPVSMREFVMNMPEMIYVLREFSCLKYLILSWSKWCDSYDLPEHRMISLMNWLYSALGSENANINLQLSYKMHPGSFHSALTY